MNLPFLVRRLGRVNGQPVAAHLYVTDRCNLHCGYCTEFDNARPHPELVDLKRWLGKVRDLGCIRVGLQGGEPLMHPDIVETVAWCRELGLGTSMSTNGFLLKPEIVQALGYAGLGSLHVSIDRMTPDDTTRKSLATIGPKLAYLKDARFGWSISGVLYRGSTDDARQLLDYALDAGISVQSRLVHAGVDGNLGVDRGDRDALAALIDYQQEQKRRGRKIRTVSALFDYQRALLDGKRYDWTCLAGHQFIFVSARGEFWLCSMNRTPAVDIMSVTPDTLRQFVGKKACQKDCGVYCTVADSLFNNHPLRFIGAEIRDRVPGIAYRLTHPGRRSGATAAVNA